VLLLDAQADYELPAALGGNKERALVKLRATVATFEQERAAAEPLPGWGAAEAYLFLGRELLEHGDAVAARDALERALLLAPEYVQARALMAKITSG
jgi:Tfp pilus assembly protein PilF